MSKQSKSVVEKKQSFVIFTKKIKDAEIDFWNKKVELLDIRNPKFDGREVFDFDSIEFDCMIRKSGLFELLESGERIDLYCNYSGSLYVPYNDKEDANIKQKEIQTHLFKHCSYYKYGTYNEALLKSYLLHYYCSQAKNYIIPFASSVKT